MKISSRLLLKYFVVGFFAILELSNCRPRSGSGLKSSDEAYVAMARVPGSKDIWEVNFPDAGDGKYAAGQVLHLKWDVESKHPAEGIDCADLKKGPEKITLAKKKDDKGQTFFSFQVRVDSSFLEKCDSHRRNNLDPVDQSRKISLACMNKGDWEGVKRLEGCLYKDPEMKQLLAKGYGTPGSSASSLEPMKTKSGLSLTQNEARQEDTNNNMNYGKKCAETLGSLPAFNCVEAGETIPITKDGVEVPFGQYESNMKCDNPAYLGLGNDGQCVPYARLGRLPTYRKDGSINPDVDTVFICRRYALYDTDDNGNNTQRPADAPRHEDVAVIQHNRITGETCWFQALSGFQTGNRYKKPLPTWRVPPPNEDDLPQEIKNKNEGIANPIGRAMAAKDFWIHPSDSSGFKCIGCHDSDPFMFSPYVAQMKMKLPDGTQTYLLPCDPAKPGETQKTLCATPPEKRTGRYSQVHKLHSPPNWPTLYSIKPKLAANADQPTKDKVQACVSCHRLGSENTCAKWAPDSTGQGSHMFGSRTDRSQTYPFNHWMPINPGAPEKPGDRHHNFNEAEWADLYKAAADAMGRCCALWNRGNPENEFNQNCEATLITTTVSDPVTNVVDVPLKLSAPAKIPEPIAGQPQPQVSVKLDGAIPVNSKVVKAMLRIDLKHPYIGQVKIYLRKNSPVEGQSVRQLLIFDGTNKNTVPFPAQEDILLTLSSEDSNGPLAEVIGKLADGDWVMSAEDIRKYDEGQVAGFDLTLSVQKQ